MTKRRSARVLQHDPIIAPGFGTRKDIERLSAALSTETPFPPEAVETMMKARGRGLGKQQDEAAAAPAVSTAWADFMKEEGVETETKESSTSTTTKRTYELHFASPNKNKKAKRTGGILLQAGTLDSKIVGRSKLKAGADYHLPIPTAILSPKIAIAKVVTSCTAAHSIAIDVNGVCYAWGRNESSQLGSGLPENVALPTKLDGIGDGTGSKVVDAAVGKGHSIFLLQNGELWAVGANKAGQCGVRNSTDVPNFRKCVLPEDVEIVQVCLFVCTIVCWLLVALFLTFVSAMPKISCGEDFSVALSSEGHVYTTGSSEFGQLGNGETGEYFVSANKLAYANCNVFTRRSTFCHAPNEKLHVNNEKCKAVPLNEEVLIQAIACGKHHTIALEASSEVKPRVFSWGTFVRAWDLLVAFCASSGPLTPSFTLSQAVETMVALVTAFRQMNTILV